jgi:HAE1 family hydrophobic/amphiphilic exporter-1
MAVGPGQRIALMYLILVIQFGSFTAPLPVMLSLPALADRRGGSALLVTRGTLNLMSFIGVIMLMGWWPRTRSCCSMPRACRARRHEREEALMAAGRKRLRPILMTTFALIAGMMPVAIGVGEGASSTGRWRWRSSAARSRRPC